MDLGFRVAALSPYMAELARLLSPFRRAPACVRLLACWVSGVLGLGWACCRLTWPSWARLLSHAVCGPLCACARARSEGLGQAVALHVTKRSFCVASPAPAVCLTGRARGAAGRST